MDRHLRRRVIAAEDDMASLLPLEVEACSLECLDTFSTGNPG